jgi:phage tail sheath protein FI
MSSPTFGIEITRLDNEPHPAVKADMAVIGLVGTAPGADAEKYPLNDPVLVFSDDATAVTGLGTEGTLAGQLELINAQPAW